MAVDTQPDIVVLGLTLNDAEPALFTVDPSAGTVIRRPREAAIPEGLSDVPVPQTPIFKLRTAQLAWKVFQSQSISSRTTSYYRSLYASGNPHWESAKKSLQKLMDICEENKIRCYIVLFPVLYELNDNYPFKDIHTLIINEVNARRCPSIHFIDLLPYLKGENYQSLWVHPIDQHPNDIVHEIVAQALAASIQFVGVSVRK